MQRNLGRFELNARHLDLFSFREDGDKLYIGDHVGQDENAVTVRGKVGEEGTPGAEVVSVTTAPVAWQSWLGRHARITPLCYCVP